MQAIRTRYIGPRNTKGSRVSARAQAGSLTIEYDDALNLDENHKAAAQALIKKLKWEEFEYVSGVYNGDYYHIETGRKV